MHPAAFYYGKILNATHFQGDDPLAWTYPYFPHTDTTIGMNSDCVQVRRDILNNN